jgi:hypothetical protein
LPNLFKGDKATTCLRRSFQDDSYPPQIIGSVPSIYLLWRFPKPVSNLPKQVAPLKSCQFRAPLSGPAKPFDQILRAAHLQPNP